MKRVLLVQLPIPQLSFGRQTGNTPLAAACLKSAADSLPDVTIDILPESVASYLGDRALLDYVAGYDADIIGFSVYSWNLKRSLYFAQRLKQSGNPLIIFGGPEVTADNKAVESDRVDFYVTGEGEAVFKALLSGETPWDRRYASAPADSIFKQSRSPYLDGFLEAEIENSVLLETQRGCPYRCGYCYYSKSRKSVAVKEEALLIEAVQWAVDREVEDVYLLDPSLNARPKLKDLLKKISAINKGGKTKFISEIRAEAIDETLADLFAAAGFSFFEIGLQSINPQALRIMNRPLDKEKFLKGVGLLKKRDILPRLDLIAGLPGDSLETFIKSVDFIYENDLRDDVQVFPLSVLPGTDFRKNSLELGLVYSPEPPYTIISAPDFPEQQIVTAFDYSEYRLETTFHPFPDPDASWRSRSQQKWADAQDVNVEIGGASYTSKIILNGERPIERFIQTARRLTHPYQLLVGPNVSDREYIGKALRVLTESNPHTPLEIVFFNPAFYPDIDEWLDHAKLERPHFLDIEQRFMFPESGNRALLVTNVTSRKDVFYDEKMIRNLYWWKGATFPDAVDFENLSDFDGVLVDVNAPVETVEKWQDSSAKHSEELLPLTFSSIMLQQRWLKLIKSDEYYFGALRH